jgi:hypothetical protein
MRDARKLLVTLVALGLTAGVTVLGAFSAFSATTASSGNAIATGTVALEDNDAGSVLYNVTNAKPGDSVEKCIRVAYTGSIASAVRIYAPDAVGTLGQYVDLTVEAGTQAAPTFPDCSGFTADGAPLFSGTLAGFAGTHNDWASGVSTLPASASSWNLNDAVVYRIVATVQDNQNASGLSTNPHSFVWEARNT